MILESQDAERVEVAPGCWRQSLLSGHQVMMCRFTLQQGVHLPEHQHGEEQAGFVISGAVELTVDGRTHVARAGSCYLVYSHQRHAARALEDAVVVDAFSPPCADHLRPDAVRPRPRPAPEPVPPGAPRRNFLDASDSDRIEMAPGFWRQTLLSGDRLMLCLFTMRGRSVLAEHRHPHEQVGMVISGAVRLTVAGDTQVTRGGCCYFVPSGDGHHATVLEDSLVVDAFSPPRADYLADGGSRT